MYPCAWNDEGCKIQDEGIQDKRKKDMIIGTRMNTDEDG
jgi:hypothetical protein